MDFIKDLNIDKVRNLAEDAFNQAKPKTDVEARVYEVLSHKNWGASTTLMNEIAQDTFDYERFLIVTKLMWEAVETPRPAAWRVIFKGLTLLEHLVKNGSERCVDDARNHSHLLRSLDRFNYYEGTVDRGIGVREKSKQITEMLGDDERIREERTKARQLKEKFAGRTTAASSGGVGGSKYAGYGNSDAGWNTGGGGGGGVGSSGRDSGNQGYAGRYGEGGVGSGAARSARSKPAATMVNDIPKKEKKLSSSSAKVKKVKKKEKKESAPASAPEIDLFSFDTAPSEPVKTADNQFDAFQTATPAAANDDFGDFQQIAPSSAVEFDAFGSAPSPATQPTAFDAFGVSSSQPMNSMQQPHLMGGYQQNQMGSNMNAVNNGFGNMNLQSNQIAPAPAPNNDDGDDFGDFEDAEPSSVKAPKTSSDPLSKLISLDGLTKNTKKEEKPNQTADNQQINAQQGMMNNAFGAQPGFQQQGQITMGSGLGSDIGAKNIDLMAPISSGNHMMGGQQQQGMMQNQMMGGGTQGGMMNNTQQNLMGMQGGVGMGMQGGMGMNNMHPGMGGNMMNQQQGNMMNQQHGGMSGMQGNMMHQQQGGMGGMQGNMMGGNGMGGMQGNMMGGNGMVGMQGNVMNQQGSMGGMNMGNMQGNNMGGMGQSQFGQFR